MKLLIRWIIVAIALVVAVWLIPGIRIEDTTAWIAVGVMAAILGLVNAIAIFVMQLNYRMDILMLKELSTFKQVGYYSLGTQIAEQIWHIPFAIEMIILSRSANTNDDLLMHKTVASIFRISIALGVVIAVIIFFMVPFMVPAIFGKEFVPTVKMIRIILPAFT